jgi:ketosteroid isomerase-like protein
VTTIDQDANMVRGLEDQRYDAMLRGDVAAFEALCHPELLYTHSTGATDTLESLVAQLNRQYYVYHSIHHPIDRVVVTGDVALVLGEMNAEITSGGVEKTLRNKCLAVWVRSESTWKLLAYQPTRL